MVVILLIAMEVLYVLHVKASRREFVNEVAREVILVEESPMPTKNPSEPKEVPIDSNTWWA